MTTTRLGLYGGARQPYGSFAGKETAAPPLHPVDEITRLGLYGGARPLYGSFADKELASGGAHPVSNITRLGMYGGARALYGDFSGKELEVVVPVVPGSGGGPIFRPAKPRLYKQIISFKGLSFDAFEEPIQVEESSVGIQLEINRFQKVVDTLEAQMTGIDSEIELFKERLDLIRVKLLQDEAKRAGLFITELLLQMLQLRGIRRRRVEEEELLIILMFDE